MVVDCERWQNLPTANLAVLLLLGILIPIPGINQRILENCKSLKYEGGIFYR
jgi:hypothetical protein